MVTSHVDWRPSYRLIAARLPRLNVFESVSDSTDLAAVLAIEALTNPRLAPTVGRVGAIPIADRVSGPGATFIMAAFAYPSISRFSDERQGAYYAAEGLTTAIAEVSFHRERFASKTPTPPMDFDERIIEADIAADVEDARSIPSSDPIYDANPANYGHAQAFASAARATGAQGIVYNSVRHAHGACVAIFIPRLIANAHTTGYIGLRWDGKRIIDSYRKQSLTTHYPDEP
jgi:hypothetical protein